MIVDLWHVGLVVSDLERAIAFYRDALGLELRHRQDQANPYTASLVGYADASLRIAQMRLPGPDRGRSGHLALQVADIDELRPRLEAAGAVFVNEPAAITAGINTGGRAVYLTDPDGITLELVQPPAVQLVTPVAG